MKRILTVLLILTLSLTPLIADSNLDDKLSLMVEADMYLGAKFGIKYDVNYKNSFITTFGANMVGPTQMCYSLYGQWHSKQTESSFNVDINYGIIQGVLDMHQFTENKYLYINPGVTMHLSYPILDQINLGAQAGMVFMIGYDLGSWATSLEPYAGITLTYTK